MCGREWGYVRQPEKGEAALGGMGFQAALGCDAGEFVSVVPIRGSLKTEMTKWSGDGSLPNRCIQRGLNGLARCWQTDDAPLVYRFG